MKFETVLHATIETVGEAGVIFNPRFARFYEWLLRHDEKQREEITRLQAQVASMERIMEREAEKNTKALKPKVAGWQTDDKAGQP